MQETFLEPTNLSQRRHLHSQQQFLGGYFRSVSFEPPSVLLNKLRAQSYRNYCGYVRQQTKPRATKRTLNRGKTKTLTIPYFLLRQDITVVLNIRCLFALHPRQSRYMNLLNKVDYANLCCKNINIQVKLILN